MQSTKQANRNKPTLKVRTKEKQREGKYHTKHKLKQSPIPASRERDFNYYGNSNTIRARDWDLVEPTSTDMSDHMDKYSVDFCLDSQDMKESYAGDGDANKQNNFNSGIQLPMRTEDELLQTEITQRHSFPEEGSSIDFIQSQHNSLSYNNSMFTDMAINESKRPATIEQGGNNATSRNLHESTWQANGSTLDPSTSTERRFTKFPFGVKRTSIALVFAIAGLILGVFCRHSTDIVRLDIPMDIGDPYEEITTMGIFYMETCWTQEEERFLTAAETNNSNSRHLRNTQEKHTNNYVINGASSGERTCEKLKITTEMVGDGLWNTVFFAVGMATSLGFAVVLFLIASTFWENVNLLPIAIGIFLTYLFQSLAFFFFDTELCKVHGCHNSSGTLLAILSPVCWFISGLAVLNMMLNAKANKEFIKRRQEAVKATKLERNRKDASNRISFFNSRERTGAGDDTGSSSSSSTEVIDLDKMLASLPNPQSL